MFVHFLVALLLVQSSTPAATNHSGTIGVLYATELGYVFAEDKGHDSALALDQVFSKKCGPSILCVIAAPPANVADAAEQFDPSTWPSRLLSKSRVEEICKYIARNYSHKEAFSYIFVIGYQSWRNQIQVCKVNREESFLTRMGPGQVLFIGHFQNAIAAFHQTDLRLAVKYDQMLPCVNTAVGRSKIKKEQLEIQGAASTVAALVNIQANTESNQEASNVGISVVKPRDHTFATTLSVASCQSDQ